MRTWLRLPVWLRILSIFLGWQLIIYLASWLFTSLEILPFAPSYSRPELIADSLLPPFLARLGGFDGVHYYTIAQEGYSSVGGIQAFFPLYPLLIRAVTLLTGNAWVSGLLISSGCLYGFLLVFFRLLAESYGQDLAWRTLLLTLFLPASFFYATVYSESLFLFLLVSTWYAWRHHRLWWVSYLGSLLSACRIVGVIAVVTIIVEHLYHAWQEHRLAKLETWLTVGIISLGCLGLVTYMVYLGINFGDPLYFMTVQSSFGAGRETSHLILLPQVYYRYAKMFIIGLPWDWKTYAIAQELILSTLYLLGLGYILWENYRRREVYPWSWLLFSAGAFIVPTLTGNFSSMPRYLLVCLVINILMSKYLHQKRWQAILFYLVCGSLMLVNLLLFVQGYWVS